MKIPVPYHRHERLLQAGICLMVAGLVAVALPPRPLDPFATEHEIWAVVRSHWWWQACGWTAFMVGNLVRLVGVQGHPGMPFPWRFGRMNPELAAMLVIRHRMIENRRNAAARPRPVAAAAV